MAQKKQYEIATLGGGCFWCLEAIYNDVQGVQNVISGYSGGKIKNPSYEEVCTGTTGHAEVVQITFDTSSISFQNILEIFFSIHDPTQLNRQGNDIGPQYRSIIFFHSSAQKEIAEHMVKDLQKLRTWNNPIVTEITPFEVFYQAEDYHQEFYKKNPFHPYCQLLIAPKIEKFQKKYSLNIRLE